jgi:hypothetical protein
MAKDALSAFEIFTSKCVKGLHTKKHFLCDEAQKILVYDGIAKMSGS